MSNKYSETHAIKFKINGINYVMHKYVLDKFGIFKVLNDCVTTNLLEIQIANASDSIIEYAFDIVSGNFKEVMYKNLLLEEALNIIHVMKYMTIDDEYLSLFVKNIWEFSLSIKGMTLDDEKFSCVLDNIMNMSTHPEINVLLNSPQLPKILLLFGSLPNCIDIAIKIICWPSESVSLEFKKRLVKTIFEVMSEDWTHYLMWDKDNLYKPSKYDIYDSIKNDISIYGVYGVKTSKIYFDEQTNHIMLNIDDKNFEINTIIKYFDDLPNTYFSSSSSSSDEDNNEIISAIPGKNVVVNLRSCIANFVTEWYMENAHKLNMNDHEINPEEEDSISL
jgi:hypothetical protein